MVDPFLRHAFKNFPNPNKSFGTITNEGGARLNVRLHDRPQRFFGALGAVDEEALVGVAANTTKNPLILGLVLKEAPPVVLPLKEEASSTSTKRPPMGRGSLATTTLHTSRMYEYQLTAASD